MNRVFACWAAAAIISAAALFALPDAALASERSSGDSWTYGIEFHVEGIPVDGTLVYSYVGYDAIEANGTSIPVHVMKVSGSFSGSELDAAVNTSVTGLVDGYAYESEVGYGVVGLDVRTVVNISIGYDEFSTGWSYETGNTILLDEPLLSPFDPDSPEPTSMWNQTIRVDVSETYDDGTVDDADESTSIVTYHVACERMDAPLETGAGTFDVHMITITGGSEMVVVWYSKEVGSFVRLELRDSADSDPSFVASLLCYDCKSADSIPPLALAVAGVILAAAVLALVLVTAFRRGRRVGERDVDVPLDPVPQTETGELSAVWSSDEGVSEDAEDDAGERIKEGV